MILTPPAPTAPSVPWLEAFSAHLRLVRPTLQKDNAERCALLAHGGTWLLDPEEAAELWLAAIEASARERALRGRRD